MIKLTQIKKQGNFISCYAFVEDSKTPFELVYNVELDEVEPYELPKGYEYCKAHVRMAKYFFRKKIESENLPTEKLIMWY